MLVEVAGSLIACIRVELSMRALESAYLNGVSCGKKMSYRFSLSGDETRSNSSLRMKRKRIFQRMIMSKRITKKKRFHLDAQKSQTNDFSPQKLKAIKSKYPCNLKVANYLLSSVYRAIILRFSWYYMVKFMRHTFIAKSVPRARRGNKTHFN